MNEAIKLLGFAVPSFTRARLRLSIAALFMTSSVLAGCGNGTGPSDGPPDEITTLPRPLTAIEQDAIQAGNSFGVSLLKQLASQGSPQNVVISPFSASVALGMAYAGANGATATDMRSVLGWGDRSRDEIMSAYRELPALLTGLDAAVTVQSANAMWVRDQFTIQPQYVTDMRTFFGADVRSGDFGPATVADMNSWASEKTNGLIPTVVDQLSDEMVVMLMNALYFKGSWRTQFDPARTQSQRFTQSNGTALQVPMMRRTGDMLYASFDGAQWAELSYGNTAYVMTLVLPDSATSVQSWLASSTAASLATGFASLSGQSVELSLPRFQLKVGYQLKDALSAMGMGVAFDRFNADFTRIADDLFMTHVKQDVYIDVNEEGTEAAAVTQVGIGVTSVPVRPVMTIDRPFLFFIRDRIGGTLLFAGLIDNPLAQ